MSQKSHRFQLSHPSVASCPQIQSAVWLMYKPSIAYQMLVTFKAGHIQVFWKVYRNLLYYFKAVNTVSTSKRQKSPIKMLLLTVHLGLTAACLPALRCHAGLRRSFWCLHTPEGASVWPAQKGCLLKACVVSRPKWLCCRCAVHPLSSSSYSLVQSSFYGNGRLPVDRVAMRWSYLLRSRERVVLSLTFLAHSMLLKTSIVTEKVSWTAGWRLHTTNV